MRVIVSECLRGTACRYDGGAKPNSAVGELCSKVDVVGVCPETASRLPVPVSYTHLTLPTILLV